MCDRKAVIKNADMSEEMQQDAVDCATQALEKFNIEKVGILFLCDPMSFLTSLKIHPWPTLVMQPINMCSKDCMLTYT